jgi:predicted alpha/beta hydrolase family esterase
VTARFWQWLLLLEVALAALAAFSLPWLTTVPLILAWVLYFMLLQVLLIAAAYVGAVAIDFAHGRRDVFGSVLRAPWVIAYEFCVLGWLQWRMAIEPYTRRGDSHLELSGSNPVLLLHGVLCNRAVWSFIRRRLLGVGFGPVIALNLEPTLSSIDVQAVAVARALEALQEERCAAPVIVISHSMGGLVARAAIRTMTSEQIAERIAALITVATPHYGSDMARLFRGAAAQQLVPGSSWLVGLNKAQWSAMQMPVVSIYSHDDNLVAPRDSAVMPGAEARGLNGLGHFSLLMSGRVWRELRQALQPFAPRPL